MAALGLSSTGRMSPTAVSWLFRSSPRKSMRNCVGYCLPPPGHWNLSFREGEEGRETIISNRDGQSLQPKLTAESANS